MERALRVVLERAGAEDRHHRVAGELLDRPARELDLLAHRVVEALELRADALRITIARVRRRADEVGEENRDELALFTRAHGRSLSGAQDGCERLFPGAETVVELGVRRRQRAEHADAVPVDAGLQEQEARAATPRR